VGAQRRVGREPRATAGTEVSAAPARAVRRWWPEWLDAPLLGIGALVAAAGFAQFGGVATLGDVAAEFGEVQDGPSIAEQAGLSGTALGVGLAVIRFSGLLSLPLSASADRLGRRRVLLGCAAAGLAITACAALAPGYWAFVAILALARPLILASETVGEVSAAELSSTTNRARAIAVVAASFGIGSGLIAVTRGVLEGVIGFRGVFALVLLPLLALPFLARHLKESEHYRSTETQEDKPVPVLGAVGPRFRRHLAVLFALVFAISVVTGPANSFIFVYAENVVGMAPMATAALVVAAAPTGLVGLLVGRWCADTLGRRGTAAVAMALVGVAGVITYSGPAPAAVIGYLAAVTAGSIFAPAAGALQAELFPTEVRAATAGWLVAGGILGAVTGLLAFGTLADHQDAFDTAAVLVFLPAAATAVLVAAVPETKGRELDEVT
jgi:MFS family permease